MCMGETTELPISKTDINELRLKLERLRDEVPSFDPDLDDAIDVSPLDRVCDLIWEALHCPADATWLQPSPQLALID